MLDYTKAELKALHNADDKPSGALPRAIRLACPTSRVLEIGFSGAQRLITYREEGLVAFGVTASSLARGRWMVCRPLDQLPAFAHTVRPDIMILWRHLQTSGRAPAPQQAGTESGAEGSRARQKPKSALPRELSAS